MSDVRMRIAIATAIFCSLAVILYVRAHAEPRPIVAWLLSVGPTLAVLLWIQRDAHRRRVAEVHDLGFLLMIFWPVAIPWYAFASRGRSGWKLLAGLIALMSAPAITGAVCAAIFE